MASIINSDDGVISGTAGLKSTGANDGALNIQTNGTNAITVSSAQTVAINGNNISADNSLGFRNRFINGDMRIDQRNAGASVTLTSGGIFTVDRWQGYEDTDGVMTAQQDTSAPTGFVNSVKLTTTTADATLASAQFCLYRQTIEGTNVSDLAWGTASAKTVTLSFWVRSSLTGTFGGSLTNSAGNRSYPFTYSISSTNTWEQKSVTIPGDTTGTWLTTTGIGIYFQFGLGVGTTYSGTAGAWAAAQYFSATGATSVIGTLNATWYITGVQLEVGSVATPFERRDYGRELIMCQRYYYKEPSTAYLLGYLDGSLADYPSAFVFHPVEMRATPTTVFESLGTFYYNSGSAGTNFTPSGGTTSYNGNSRRGLSRKNAISNGPGSTQEQKAGQWQVQLSFSAEL